MSDSLKNFLIELVIGFVAAIAICLMVDVTGAETTADLLRLLSDGFFAAAAIFLAVGGITFTTNGGVFDGLGFTFKSVIGRFKRDYEENRVTFAEYREEQRKKARSPKNTLLVGLILLVISLIFVSAFYLTAN